MAGNICFDIQEALNAVNQQAGGEIERRDKALQQLSQKLKEETAKAGEQLAALQTKLDESEADRKALRAQVVMLTDEAIAAKQGIDSGPRTGPKAVSNGNAGEATPAAS